MIAITTCEKALDRAAMVSAIVELAAALGQKHGEGEALGALMISLACMERGVNLKRRQSNESLVAIRDCVDAAIKRLGVGCTAADIAIELELGW